MQTRYSLSIRNFFTKLLHWEYWPMGLVYAPVYTLFIWYCIRSGFRFFFTAGNPGIQNGGMVLESKYSIYRQLPVGSYPATLFFKAQTTGTTVLKQVQEAGFRFPLILKPDIGMKGLAVKKIEDAAGLVHFSARYTVDFLVQELVEYKTELGIFWVRLPGSAAGKITGIVGKELLTITGTGRHTMHELLVQNARYRLQLRALEQQYGHALQEVLPAGEQRVLAPYGNHARGAKFTDLACLATDKLNSFMNGLCTQIPDFYFGRLDIRCSSIEALENGRDFSIIELNGAGSEPTHMYDPKHSIFFAWKEIAAHWTMLWRISRMNHQKGHSYLPWKKGIQLFRDNIRYTKKLELLHRQLLQPGKASQSITPQNNRLFTAARAV